MIASSRRPGGRRVGRYVIHDEIAAGGMAAVHLGKLEGPVGFARTVAIKRLHAHLEHAPEFVAMFLDEARLAARVRHPNVVSTIDVVAHEDEVVLVMDYVHGEVLSRLVRGGRLPPRIASGILGGVLHGLHAAHETRGDRGEPLGIVHRDVSPQNIIVGVDGVPRVLDFGIAKATWNTVTTREGQMKGKLAYMAPEQVRAEKVDRRTDVYAASVVLWEILTGERLFEGDNAASLVKDIVDKGIPPPGRLVEGLPEELDAVVLRGLARDRGERFRTAREMAVELERVVPPATAREIGEWVESTAAAQLERRREMLRRIDEGEPTGPEDAEAERPSQVPTKVPARGPAPTSGATQLSQVTTSVSSSDVVIPARTSRTRLAVGAALALAVAAGGYAAVTRQAPPVPTSSAVATSAPPPAPAETAIPAPASESAPEPTAPAPARSVAPSWRPRAAPIASSAPSSTAAPRGPCNPPYVLVDGIKRYKADCL